MKSLTQRNWTGQFVDMILESHNPASNANLAVASREQDAVIVVWMSSLLRGRIGLTS